MKYYVTAHDLSTGEIVTVGIWHSDTAEGIRAAVKHYSDENPRRRCYLRTTVEPGIAYVTNGWDERNYQNPFYEVHVLGRRGRWALVESMLLSTAVPATALWAEPSDTTKPYEWAGLDEIWPEEEKKP